MVVLVSFISNRIQQSSSNRGTLYTSVSSLKHCCTLLMVTGGAVNTLRPRQNGRHFADDIFKCIFLNKDAWITLKISLKFVPKVPINNIPALVQIMAWRRPGDKPLSQPMMVSLLTHICVTRPQWVKAHQTKHIPKFKEKIWGHGINYFLALQAWRNNNYSGIALYNQVLIVEFSKMTSPCHFRNITRRN